MRSLADSLGGGGMLGDVASTCETAYYFYKAQVEPKIRRFRDSASASSSVAAIRAAFPFSSYFSGAENFDWDSVSTADDALKMSSGCFHHIERLFSELDEYKAFEQLRTQAHRSDYLITKQVCSD